MVGFSGSAIPNMLSKFFKGAKGVAMVTKFGQKISKKCTDFSSAQKNRGLIHTNSKVFGVGEFEYAI